jgi:hypothetical protein
MAPKRPARSGLIAIAPILRRAAIGWCCGVIAVVGVAICVPGFAAADPAVTGNVPLPVPAPLPKTGTAPPPAAAAKPGTETGQTPSLFPFSALFGNKSSTPAPSAPSPIDIVADGSSVVVRDRKLVTQDLYPLSQTPLRYLLAERINLLRDTDVVSVSADDSFATVVIEQKQLFVGTDRLMIMFDAKDLTLKQWTVTDPQGFDTTVAVYNLDSTKKPDPNLFVINYQREQTGVQ